MGTLMPGPFDSQNQRDVPVKASAFNRVAHIQIESGTQNASGGRSGTWNDVAGLSHVPVAIKSWNSFTLFQGQQLWPGTLVRIFMRYRGSVDINNKMRVVVGTHIYYVRGVLNYNRMDRVIGLFCEELQAAGSQ